MLIDVLKEWWGNRCPRRNYQAHDTQARAEGGQVFLRCLDCGRRSPGWDVGVKVQRSASAWPRPQGVVPAVYVGECVIGGEPWDVLAPEDGDAPVRLDSPDAARLTVLDAALLYELWERNRHLLQ